VTGAGSGGDGRDGGSGATLRLVWPQWQGAGTSGVRGLTIAEFVPRQVMHPQRLLAGFPLLPSPGAAE
jgi:hypothetical protein